MTAEARRGLDAVEEGPVSSDLAGSSGTTSPIDGSGHPTVTALVERYGDAIRGHRVSAGDQHVVWIAPAWSFEILRWLRDDPAHRYDHLADVTGVDYGHGRPVNVVYQLWSNPHKRALRLRCELPVDALVIESVTALWQTANWLEREVWDMFGVTFRGHPDPRRILMPEDYAEGHPLRKDFPLRGRFSRAEQTRRALAQDVDRFYTPHDLKVGRTPQTVELSPPPADASSGADTPA
jgi:NADH-quinone oxidoreductase subunit C